MRSPGDNRPGRSSGEAAPSAQNAGGRSGVVGNERLTALAGALLLVLIVVELVTAASLRTLLTVHVLAGVLLAGPLAVKLGSTGYRFVRYYAGSPPYVRKGPPHLALRIMAPLLLGMTLLLVGSGFGLLVTGPAQPGPLIVLHNLTAALWLSLIAIHTYAYLRRVPALVADDFREDSPQQAPGRGQRLGVSLGSLLAGALAAILLLPTVATWLDWSKTAESGPPGPLVAGALLAVMAVLAGRLFRWK